jgi:Cu/Ag efflux protein CusF
MIRHAGQTFLSSIRLHGTVRSIDRANRKLSLTHLRGLEYFWSWVASDCSLSQDLAIEGIKPGQKVTVVITHWTQGRCMVTEFMLAQ